MTKNARRRVAEEAARFMVDGTETEYLYAKERAIHKLGLSNLSHLPTNRRINDCIGRLAKEDLGPDEVNRRLLEMRTIAEQLLIVLDNHDPFLIGSTLSGKIRHGSDIDLHAYSDDYTEIQQILADWNYDEVEEEIIENLKGTFVHLRWYEKGYPVEITIYPWNWRDVVLFSSVTSKPMKRVDLAGLRNILRR